MQDLSDNELTEASFAFTVASMVRKAETQVHPDFKLGCQLIVYGYGDSLHGLAFF